jgi:hypothetical protein
VEKSAFRRVSVISKYCSNNQIKNTVRWAGNLALMGERRGHLEDLGVDGKIILKLGLKEMGLECMNWG